ncbi:MAG: CAP domain-containing protein [Actinomycetota bacterium]
MSFGRALPRGKALFTATTAVVLSLVMLLPWMKTSHAAPLADEPMEGMGKDATTATSSSSGSWSFNDSEQCFMNRINRRRQRKGKSRLNVDKQLGYVARRHARSMARSRSMYHDDNIGSKVTRWRTLAQNSGKGGPCKKMFKMFWRSSAHRANMLGPYRFLGVGVEKRGGNYYVQQVFESKRDPGNVWHKP